MSLINQLATPVEKIGDYNESVILTHEAWGLTLQPWITDQPLSIYTTQGVLLPDGSYRAYRDAELCARCTQSDLDDLLAANPDTGKPAGMFRFDDVQALYYTIRARQQPA